MQAGKLGVDLSVQTANLRNQTRLEQTAIKNVYGRNCLEIGGVWIDEGFDAKMPTFTSRPRATPTSAAGTPAEDQGRLTLGNHLVWVTPNGTALIIDTSDGKEKLTDDEIDELFVAKK